MHQTAGPNWPYGGEIDILEGVHNNENNQVTWHTGPGCSLTSNDNFTGSVVVRYVSLKYRPTIDWFVRELSIAMSPPATILGVESWNGAAHHMVLSLMLKEGVSLP